MSKPSQVWYIVNVEAVIQRGDRYLLAQRSEQETHAPGVLTLVGGKVEDAGISDDILEATLCREILEEVGLEVAPEMVYLESKAFIADDGDPVIDIVFLCRCDEGEAQCLDPAEVTDTVWLTAEEAVAHPKVPPWTRQSIRRAAARKEAR